MQTIRVLVVEDNEADLAWIRRALAHSIHGPLRALDAEYAGSLQQAVEKLRSELFHVVLLDLGLPDSRDFSTVFQIRSGFPDIPVVILSGLDDDATALSAIRDGAQSFVVKDLAAYKRIVRELICAVERHKRLEALSQNRLWDDSTQFLSAGAFQTIVSVLLPAAAVRGLEPAMFVVHPARSSGPASHPTPREWIDRCAEALRRTFTEDELFVRMDEATLAVFLEDGHQHSESDLTDCFSFHFDALPGQCNTEPVAFEAELLPAVAADAGIPIAMNAPNTKVRAASA